MAETTSKFKNLKEQMEAFKKQMADLGRSALEDGAKEIFEAHPILDHFGWTQYSPHFNDGDPCTFSANEPEVWFVGDEEADEDDGYFSTWEKAADDPQVLAFNAVSELLGQFDSDTLETLFGDGYKITVNRDGVEVDEYDHD